MTHVPRSTFEEIKRKLKAAAGRKAKRDEKRKDLPWAKKKKRRAPSSRRQAFDRLKAACVTYVLMRAKDRSDGFCEVGIVCRGQGPAEVWYHVWPQKLGNALKYEVRAILGSCHPCNGGEYFARKRGDDSYVKRHMEVLGAAYDDLDALKGSRKIGTAEAVEMARAIEANIERRDWRNQENQRP
jgi:hypothetical protein